MFDRSSFFEDNSNESDFFLPYDMQASSSSTTTTARTRQRRQAETALDPYRNEGLPRIVFVKRCVVGFSLVTILVMILNYVAFVSDDQDQHYSNFGSSSSLQTIRSLTKEVNLTKHDTEEQNTEESGEKERSTTNLSEGAVAAITVVGIFSFFFLCIFCSQQQAGQGSDAIYPSEGRKDESDNNKRHNHGDKENDGHHHGHHHSHKPRHHHSHSQKTKPENTNNPNHASLSTMALTTPDGTDDKQKDSTDDPAIISVPVRSASNDDNGVPTEDHYYESISTLGTVEEGRAP